MTVAYPASFDAVRAPVASSALLIADCDEAARRAERTLADGGFGRVRMVQTADAAAELDRVASVGLLWVELESFGKEAEQLLRRVESDVDRGLYAAVVAIAPELIDEVVTVVANSRTEVVVGRSELERATALSMVSLHRPSANVREKGSDESAARLRQLSDEVSRIAATLARISGSAEPATASPQLQAPSTGELPSVPAETVRAIIRARRARGKFLPADLFADPAWDMLLDLLQAELAQHRVPVSSLCIAAAVPATTALRWIKNMTERGLLVRRPDPHDARRVFMEMSRPTSHALRQFFADVGPALV